MVLFFSCVGKKTDLKGSPPQHFFFKSKADAKFGPATPIRHRREKIAGDKGKAGKKAKSEKGSVEVG